MGGGCARGSVWTSYLLVGVDAWTRFRQTVFCHDGGRSVSVRQSRRRKPEVRKAVEAVARGGSPPPAASIGPRLQAATRRATLGY